MGSWEIILASWIIQDGQHGEFHRGEEISFALEFYAPNGLNLSNIHDKHSNHTSDGRYQVNAEVTYCRDKIRVVDFGIQAFCYEIPPDGIKAGDFLTGEVLLGVDPFYYSREFNRLPGVPPLIYTWRIDQIRMQTAPYIKDTSKGGLVMMRDPAKLGYISIEQTNAFVDDEGSAEYLISCTLLDRMPRLQSSSL